MVVNINVAGIYHKDREWDCVPRIGEDVWVDDYRREDGRKYNGALKVIAVLWYPKRIEINLAPLTW